MRVIRVKNYIDEIYETCFSQENKDTLEFTQNNVKVTIKDQLSYYYSTACYPGTKDDLIKAIMIKINQQEDLLLRIKDYNENINRIVRIEEYNDVSISYTDTLESETNIGVSALNSNSHSTQADKFSGIDQTKNTNIIDDISANSQTNRVESVSAIFSNPTLGDSDPKQLEIYNATKSNITTENVAYKESELKDHNQKLPEDYGFQVVNKSQNIGQSVNNNTSKTASASNSFREMDNKASNANIKGSKQDKLRRNIDYNTNKNRLKLWRTQLPKLRAKFWNSFSNLFCYEEF